MTLSCRHKQIILLIICWLILLLPNIATMYFSTDLTYSIIKEVGYLFVIGLLLVLPATFLRARTYFIVEGILTLFFAPFEVASLYLNHITISPHFIGLVLRTNFNEAAELCYSMWPILLTLLGIWIVYWVMVAQIKNNFLFSKVIRRYSWIMLLIVIITGYIISLSILPPKEKNCTTTARTSFALELVYMKLYKIFPFDCYHALHQLWQENREIKRINQQLENFSFGIPIKNDSIEEHYVLIIGESARYDHFSINGYYRPTSPNLDQLSNLYSLKNIYSNANTTHEAVASLLSRANAFNTNIIYQEKTIIEAYKEAGYQTAWLSCQTWMDYVCRITKATDFSTEQVAGLSAHVAYDSILCHQMSDIYHHHPYPKTFSVLHTMGSHWKYSKRHPISYERFTPALQKEDGCTFISPEHQEFLINSYDNSILYTDAIISRTIEIVRQQKGIGAVIYISDHGENLYDDQQALVLHSSYAGTEYESHVPCFVWVSDTFAQHYPDKVKALQQNLHQQVSSEVIFYSLADLGNFETIMDSTKSIFSPYLLEQDTIYMRTCNGTISIIQPHSIPQ